MRLTSPTTCSTCAIFLLALHGLYLRVDARPPDTNAESRETAKLLDQWLQQGTATDHEGDYYLNMDGGHSQLRKLPGLTRLSAKLLYFFGEPKTLPDGQTYVPGRHALLGNASMVLNKSSIINVAYRRPRTLLRLSKKYRENMMWVFPSANDYGRRLAQNDLRRGEDLYLTNTPYAIASIGASGSDQPFLKAWSATMRAFKPEVKQKLKQTGLLMPTIQMIFRSCNRTVIEPSLYLTGQAHPPAFEPGDVNRLKMVKMAHQMTLDSIPPLVQLKVVSEQVAVPGRDYFEVRPMERWADTPQAIVRIFRTRRYVKQIVISAEDSFDTAGKPLTYHWVLLKGNDRNVRIIPDDKNPSVAEIRIGYFGTYLDPIAQLPSNRIDIGVFVHNGTHFSAPALVTYRTIRNEWRTYDERGRIVEYAYRRWNTDLDGQIDDWDALFRLLLEDNAASFRVRLLREQFTKPELAAIQRCWSEYQAEFDKFLRAHRDKIQPQKKRKNDTPGTLGSFRFQLGKDYKRFLKKTSLLLEKPMAPRDKSVKQLLLQALTRLISNPRLYQEHTASIDRLYENNKQRKGTKAFKHARNKLVETGVFAQAARGRFRLQSVQRGQAPIVDRLTNYEKNCVERFNIIMLGSLLYPEFMPTEIRPIKPDPALGTEKSWQRDVYHYDAAGRLSGWSRFDKGEITPYSPSGNLADGRAVTYRMSRSKPGKAGGPFQLAPIVKEN